MVKKNGQEVEMIFGVAFTSPRSPSMESLGLGSCWPLIIFTTSCFLICPGNGSSNTGLKGPANRKRLLKKNVWLQEHKGASL